MDLKGNRQWSDMFSNGWQKDLGLILIVGDGPLRHNPCVSCCFLGVFAFDSIGFGATVQPLISRSLSGRSEPGLHNELKVHVHRFDVVFPCPGCDSSTLLSIDGGVQCIL